MNRLKPVLRWAGSKQRLLPTLLQQSPIKFDRYHEPFAGSAALFFALNPQKASLTDINPDLINFYKQLKRNPEKLHTQTTNLPVTEKNYIKTRERFGEEEDLWTRASLFWYLNRNCFNGLYRTNKAGKFNVPLGRKLPPMISLDHAKACASRLRKARIEACDYEKTIDQAQKNDFIYVDPPYKRASSRDRGEYGPGAMNDLDIERLFSALDRASDRGVLILFSYNQDISERLTNWKHESVNGRFLISANPEKRHLISEFTSRNYRLEATS